MPGQHVRHGRASRWDWGDSQPARSDLDRAAVEAELGPVRHGRGKHDRKAFCKKLHGPHEGVAERRDGSWQCKWVADFHRELKRWEGARWACYHEVRCRGCGKVMAHKLASLTGCPDYPGHGEQHRAAIADAVKTQARYESRTFSPRRRWEIRGYRRPRQE